MNKTTNRPEGHSSLQLTTWSIMDVGNVEFGFTRSSIHHTPVAVRFPITSTHWEIDARTGCPANTLPLETVGIVLAFVVACACFCLLLCRTFSQHKIFCWKTHGMDSMLQTYWQYR